MRFGLDRMRRLMTTLDQPERRYDTIHVVGTNGKSSTTRMIAAILQRHGLHVGAYLSPHLVSFAERIRVDDRDVEPRAFARAVERAAHAAALVDRTQQADDRVTQFEALTAAAFSELAAREVDVAVIEAGLGGRWDATNVIPSRVQVLTSVGLSTRAGSGRRCATSRARSSRSCATAARSSSAPACIRTRWRKRTRPPSGTARGSCRRRPTRASKSPRRARSSAATSRSRARRRRPTWRLPVAAGAGRVRAAAAAVTRPRPPAGRRARAADAARRRAQCRGRRRARRVAAAADRRPAGSSRSSRSSTTRTPRGCCARCCRTPSSVVFTRSAQPARAAAGDARVAVGAARRAASPSWRRDPRRALARARELAGAGGVVLATGSIYLVADLLAPAGQRSASML